MKRGGDGDGRGSDRPWEEKTQYTVDRQYRAGGLSMR